MFIIFLTFKIFYFSSIKNVKTLLKIISKYIQFIRKFILLKNEYQDKFYMITKKMYIVINNKKFNEI